MNNISEHERLKKTDKQPAANSPKQAKDLSRAPLIDNRSKAIEQKQMIEMANRSEQITQRSSLQFQIENSSNPNHLNLNSNLIQRTTWKWDGSKWVDSGIESTEASEKPQRNGLYVNEYVDTAVEEEASEEEEETKDEKLPEYLYDSNISLSSGEDAWAKSNYLSPPGGSSEKVGSFSNVYHKTHVGGKGNSVWWIVVGGKMKVVACGSHTGKSNDSYTFHTSAKGFPKKYSR